METLHMDQDISSFHHEHRMWLRQLDFYEQEIAFFREELTKVMQKNKESFSKLEYSEEYKAIFRKKQNHIDELRAAISEHEKKMSRDQISPEDVDRHRYIAAKFNDFIQRFEMLKHNFRRFASHND